MKQQQLFDGAKRGPSRFYGQKILAAYGGGVNTIAMLVWMRENGVRPWAIVMANPGSERKATIRYRD
jgi:argininosuccinate synthase